MRMFNGYKEGKDRPLETIWVRFIFAVTSALVIIAVAAATSAEKGTTVIIDPGHGGQDGGAVGITGVYEKDINLQISVMLKEYFENAGYSVIMTRTEDADTDGSDGFHKTDDIMYRYSLAEAYPDSVFLSVHMNASTSSADKGFQVFYGAVNDSSKRLAQSVYDAVGDAALVTRLREVKAAPSTVYLMNHIPSPCVLIECGFISNASDETLLTDPQYLNDLAYVLFCGVEGYIDEVVK